MPDAVFVDYLSNMTHPNVDKRSGQNWENAGECAVDLRNMAARNNLVVFTAQQTNRSGLEKGRKKIDESPEEYRIKMEDVAESKLVVNFSDSIIGFTPDIENLIIYFHKIKGRDFNFEPFAATYYPNLSRIVDSKTDDTYKQISPLADRINLNRRLTQEEQHIAVNINEDI